MKTFLSTVLLFHVFVVTAQTDSSLSAPEIMMAYSGTASRFEAQLPELSQVPGGRVPFYTYFWDFGDGHFSRTASPSHHYNTDGEHDVRLYATNNYDMGTKPPRPVKKIKTIRSGVVSVSSDEQNFFISNGVFQLDKNANALPGSDLILISGVKPTGTNGTIYILTNEKIFDDPGFVFKSQSTYNNEQLLSPDTNASSGMFAAVKEAVITQSGSPDYGYKEHITFTKEEAMSYFSGLCKSYHSISAYEISAPDSAAQFSFIELTITPEMIRDTNAIITVTGIYFPNGSDEAYIHKLDIPVVASHDPNKMSLKETRLRYRSISKRKELTYKVQFQNDGEGDAKNIRLEMTLPPRLDPSSFKLLHLYPECPPCSETRTSACWYAEAKEDSVIFHFKDVSLPGSKAADIPSDSTKGFVRFSVKPAKNLPNRPFSARTAIYFDKNEPVLTNAATGRFRKSLSPILFLGYNFIINEKQDESYSSSRYRNNWQAGIGLAPLAPYKKFYWQAELFVNVYQKDLSTKGIVDTTEVNIDGTWYLSFKQDRLSEKKGIQLRVTPVQLRYNIHPLISLGAGLSCNMNVNLSGKEEIVYYVGSAGTPLEPKTQIINEGKDRNTPLSFNPFVEINFGKVYLGPSLGVRYHIGANSPGYLYTYACWRL